MKSKDDKAKKVHWTKAPGGSARMAKVSKANWRRRKAKLAREAKVARLTPLAKLGAGVRIKELQREIAELFEAFPDLRKLVEKSEEKK